MNTRARYLTRPILEDLKETMVFLGGPRQVGKTTLATELVGASFRHGYFNWDKAAQRRQALKGLWPPDCELIVLDEFHKHTKWKSWLKGEYDTHKKRYKFLLTGSARLDIYRRGGDSLQGRYHYYRLHPFSLSECAGIHLKQNPGQELSFSDEKTEAFFKTLMTFGGFPMPLMKQSEREWRRWQNERLEKILREDVRDLSMIQDIGNLTLLAELLPERVASVLSINSLAEDLQVNFRTIQNWLNVFERLYFCYRLNPFQSRKIASVRKEKKLYLWDWSSVSDEGDRLENLAASHLLKYCHFLHDREGWKAELCYLRDSSGRETDFLVTCDNKPWFAVEVKTKRTKLDNSLAYFREKLKIPFCYQILNRGDADYVQNGIRVMPAAKFLTGFV